MANGRVHDEAPVRKPESFYGRGLGILPVGGDREDVNAAVQAAYRALHSPAWKSLSGLSRSVLLCKFADLIAQNAEELSWLETTDNGKVIAETSAMVSRLSTMIHYYAGLAEKHEGSVVPSGQSKLHTFAQAIRIHVRHHGRTG